MKSKKKFDPRPCKGCGKEFVPDGAREREFCKVSCRTVFNNSLLKEKQERIELAARILVDLYDNEELSGIDRLPEVDFDQLRKDLKINS